MLSSFPFIVLLLFLLQLLAVQAIGIHYTWQANIHPTTGIATSIETSYKNYKSINNHTTSFFENLIQQPKTLGNKIMQEFKRYPYFLAQRNVLFGLIQVTTEETETFVKILVPNITLLKFGIPKSELQLLKTSLEKGSIGIKTTIPITGGYLSLGKGGELHFSSICNYHSDPSYSQMNNKEYKIQNQELDMRFETRIVNYKPTLVGLPPVKVWRKGLYWNTQRYFHAYVMRRFHGHLYRLMEDDMKKSVEEDGCDSVRTQRFQFNRNSK